MRLRATLGLLEKVTLSPREITSQDIAKLREAGLTDRAILDATYVCAGFNIIARIADALGFKIPSEELFARAAKLLVIFGYRRLSGFWTDGVDNRSDEPIWLAAGPLPATHARSLRQKNETSPQLPFSQGLARSSLPFDRTSVRVVQCLEFWGHT